MGSANLEWSDADDLEVIRILRDHAGQMRRKGSPKTAFTAAKAEKLLNEILNFAAPDRPSPQRPEVPNFHEPRAVSTEILFENYQNDTLLFSQGEFLAANPVFVYDIPLLAGDSVTAILVEGETGNVSMSDFHLEGTLAQVQGARKFRNGAAGSAPRTNAWDRLTPFVEVFAAAGRRLLIPSGLPSLRPQIRIEAEAGRQIRFSLLVRRCGATVMNWPGSRRGCKKLAGFLLRAAMTAFQAPSFELDGFLPDGALEKLCEALEEGPAYSPKPLPNLFGPFEEAKTRQVLHTLRGLLPQTPRPYDHVLAYISEELGACR